MQYLKVVTKRPVSQHFKESMMVDIFANIIQIIVLTSSTDTFLSIHNTNPFSHITVGVNSAKEQRLELQKDNE